MKRPATIDGIALIASTIMRTGRASRPPISLRNTAVAMPSGTESSVAIPTISSVPTIARRPAAFGRRAQRADLALVLGEELRPQRVEAARDRVADDERERDQHPDRDRRDDDADDAVAGVQRARAARGRGTTRSRGTARTTRRRSRARPRAA